MTEGSYELPEGWRWVKLGEVCDHRSGIWGPEAQEPANGFPIVRSTEIAGYRIRPQSSSIRSVSTEKAHRYALQSGDILVNKSSGSPRLVGWPAIFEDPGDSRTYLFSNFMLRLRVDKTQIDPWFTLYYLHSPTARANYLGAQDTTSGLRNLRIRDFIAQSVPLPPLDEQHRIVARIEELMERVRETKRLREEAEQDTDRLMLSILAEVFPNPRDILPPGWVCKKVIDVSEKPQYGYTQSAEEEPVGPKFLRITDIQDGNVEWQTVPYCKCDEVLINKYQLKRGDILFARSGATTGKTYLIKECPEAVFASYRIRLRLRPAVIPDYVYWFFQSPYYWDQIKPRGAAQPNVNARVLGSLQIPFPPSAQEQRRIVSYLDQVQAQVTALKQVQEATETELQRLEQSILDKAFRGELKSPSMNPIRKVDYLTHTPAQHTFEGSIHSVDLSSRNDGSCTLYFL